MADKREPLLIPPEVAADDMAIEMIRGWITGGGLHCVLKVGHWHDTTEIDERDAWGVMLADIARHVSGAIEDATGLDRDESLSRVVKSFIVELGLLSAAQGDQSAIGEDSTAETSEET